MDKTWEYQLLSCYIKVGVGVKSIVTVIQIGVQEWMNLPVTFCFYFFSCKLVIKLFQRDSPLFLYSCCHPCTWKIKYLKYQPTKNNYTLAPPPTTGLIGIGLCFWPKFWPGSKHFSTHTGHVNYGASLDYSHP